RMRRGITCLNPKIVTAGNYATVAICQDRSDGQPAFLQPSFRLLECLSQQDPRIADHAHYCNKS
ncbi:MAG TPA: hypothetical protein VJQ54_22970, partial [Candidatus Sulfotelmatobacter sp.]|nr:hypothetical protein [Candidatus Sulfotelmatobacter sp.]